MSIANKQYPLGRKDWEEVQFQSGTWNTDELIPLGITNSLLSLEGETIKDKWNKASRKCQRKNNFLYFGYASRATTDKAIYSYCAGQYIPPRRTTEQPNTPTFEFWNLGKIRDIKILWKKVVAPSWAPTVAPVVYTTNDNWNTWKQIDVLETTDKESHYAIAIKPQSIAICYRIGFYPYGYGGSLCQIFVR